MTDNYEHYISRNITAYYKKRLVSPIIYLGILLLLWLVLPLGNILAPHTVSATDSPDELFERGDPYIRTTLVDLTFTGYTAKQYGKTTGYYYYTNWGDDCVIVLLAPNTCEQGLPYIESISIRGKLTSANDSYRALLTELSGDLEWTANGLISQMPQYYFSEPAYHMTGTVFVFILYFGSMLYAVISIILYLIYMRFPFVSPPCQNLVVYGSPRQMLEEAEEELATLPQLATEDMFITEHYFIVTSPYGNALVPIQEILWIYKYSTLHKFLWYHFSISYTLHIVANKRMYIHCPKNIKSDIDGIMDYLAEANHSILTGFSEENRLKVEAVLGKPFHVEKLHALLHKKI